MSRVANKPVVVPSGVEVKLEGQQIHIKGPKGTFDYTFHNLVNVNHDQNSKEITFKEADDSIEANAQAGTARANIQNYVTGVTAGFERKLLLVGVGYRAKKEGNAINLSLGYSHPVVYDLPKGIDADVPDNTTIILKGFDNQQLGQVASEIRAKRPPEPYKGKGIRYADERIVLKETKKK